MARQETPVGGKGGKPATPRAAPMPEPAAGQSGNFDLRHILQALWRRKLLVVLPAILIGALALLVTRQLDNKYGAYVDILIDPREQRIVKIDDVVGELGGDRATIGSEAAVLESRRLAYKVVEKLDLAAREPFTPVGLKQLASSRHLRGLIASVPQSWLDLVGVPPDALAALRGHASGVAEIRSTEAVDALLGAVQVWPVAASSRVLRVYVVTNEPALSAEIANTLAELYLDEQMEAKYEASAHAREWLSERVETLREKVETAEWAVEAYREANGLAEANEQTLASKQLFELNNSLLLAQTELAERRAELNQVRSRFSSGGVDAAAEVLSSQLIERLRLQEADLERRLAELSTEYGPKHPKIINVNAEITDIRRRLQAEVRKSLAKMENEVRVLRARRATLEENFNELQGKTASLSSKQVELRSLEREAEANRAVFETFLTRLKETSAKTDLQQADARIISFADVPTQPSGPSRKVMVVGASALAFAMGCVLALLLEQMDRGLRSGEQIYREYGVPSLGLVPMLSRLQRLRTDPASFAVENPASAYSESVRSIYASAALLNERVPPRMLMFTSSLPGEGKSTLAASLARLMASYGYKVLLIDADLRKPRQHLIFSVKRTPGLAELLRGDAALEDCLVKERKTGLRLIPAGQMNFNAPDLLALRSTERFFDEFKGRYDLVIADCPPVSALCDARVMSSIADKTILVAQWAATRQDVVRINLDRLREAGADVVGIALNKVDIRKHAKYHFSDSGQYSKRYRHYYQC